LNKSFGVLTMTAAKKAPAQFDAFVGVLSMIT
jgi:hypothetical protein